MFSYKCLNIQLILRRRISYTEKTTPKASNGRAVLENSVRLFISKQIPHHLEARKFSAELVNVKKSLLSYKHSTVPT